MDTDVISSLRREEAVLARKLAAVQAVLSVYDPASAGAQGPANGDAHGDAGAQPPAEGSPPPPASAAVPDKGKRRVSAASAYASKVRAVARATIDASPTKPVPTRVIVAALQEQGIEIRGQVALNAVSALLSRSDEFVSQGRLGWVTADFAKRYGVRAPNENGAPNGYAASAPDAEGLQPLHSRA